MSEKYVLSFLFKDKNITNPLNKTEIFLCSDIYSDYRKCRGMFKKGLKTKAQCKEIRNLGQTCYLNSPEEFEKYLVRIFEEKRNYINYLKKEGSILYKYYKSDPTVFSIKKLDEDHGEYENELNEFLINENKEL